MLWARETEPINPEPLSGAQPVPTGVQHCHSGPRDAFLLPRSSSLDFIHSQAVRLARVETQEWTGDNKAKDSISLADSSEGVKA